MKKCMPGPPGDRNISHTCSHLFFLMCILAELDTQRKLLLKKGRISQATWLSHRLRNWWLAGFSPLLHDSTQEKEKCISAFQLMVEFLAPKVWGAKGWEADMCSIPLQQTSWHQMKPWPSWHLRTYGGSGMLHQEVWKQRRETGIHSRVPTRKEWDCHRRVSIGTMKCSRKQSWTKKRVGWLSSRWM